MAPLNVIALISGGKDSIYSILHVLSLGHTILCLGNLHPPPSPTSSSPSPHDGDDPESHMYQTAGHSLIPYIAQCLDIPLVRREIRGTNVSKSATYVRPEDGEGLDETEDLDALLGDIMQRFPDANAVSSGAILSTYQRTRIETVALRRGLIPLAYLWQYTTLTSDEGEDALLKHMEIMGMEARIVKVASGGLDEGTLWTDVASYRGREAVKKRIMRFGEGEGAVIGEGGEFETLVLDGPGYLWKKRIVVGEEMRQVVRGEGGTASIAFKIPGDGREVCRLEDKIIDPEADIPELPKPKVLEDVFQRIFDSLCATAHEQHASTDLSEAKDIKCPPNTAWPTTITHPDPCPTTIHFTLSGTTFSSLITTLSSTLSTHGLTPRDVTSTVVLIRDMSDFPTLNKLYSSVFTYANPPSRACVAIGSLLPPTTIAVMHITAFLPSPSPHQANPTKALHIQSRSNWAPANIGPYSQAQSVPLSSSSSSSPSARGVTVAGQIPLVPATMSFPTEFGGERKAQERFIYEATLAAQHAWRIGIEMGVKLYTSGTAFLPRVEGEGQSRWRARIAGCVWRALHAPPKTLSDEDGDGSGEEDGEDNVDLWELTNRHGAERMGGEAVVRRLPEWDVIKLHDGEGEGKGTISGVEDFVSPFFAAEVESLPMNASVEWVPGLGISTSSSRDIVVLKKNERMVFDEGKVAERMHEVTEYRTLVAGQWLLTTYFVHMSEGLEDWKGLIDGLRRDPNQGPGWMIGGTAYKFVGNLTREAEKTYVDVSASVVDSFWTEIKAGVIPCRRLWDADGRRLAAVVSFKDEVEPRDAVGQNEESD